MLVIMAFLIVLLMAGNTSGKIELSAFPKQKMNCDGWTVLRCNISSSVELDNSDKLYWNKQEEKDFKCDPILRKNPRGFECNYTREAMTLTILSSTPENTGTYFCKIKALSGHGSTNINVSLGQCSQKYIESNPVSSISTNTVMAQNGPLDDACSSTQHSLLALMFSLTICLSL